MLRMFGFFMLLPILSHLASKMQYSTPMLTGLAMGIYGLMQAFLYFPFGALSDKIGRKPVMYLGLFLLLLGSVLAANTTNIYILILARAVQGMGAISAVSSAFVADIVSEQNRTKAMMLIGIGVGLSFPLSLVLSPILYANMGSSGIFYSISACTLTAILALSLLPNIESNKGANKYSTSISISIKHILKNKLIQPWMIGVFFLHALSMMFFYIISFILHDYAIELAQQWKFYLPILGISFISSMYVVRKLEKKQQYFAVSIVSICLLLISSIAMIFSHGFNLHAYIFYAIVAVYFTGFNMLEIFQPSMISKLCNPSSRGATMGIYYTIQAFGMFFGSICAGALSKCGIAYKLNQVSMIFIFSSLLIIMWTVYSVFNYNKLQK
jgi:predicted MFS family arabinose efflux permease